MRETRSRTFGPRQFRMGERDHGEQTRVVVGYAAALGGFDHIFPRPGTRAGPPASVRDRHQRPQRHVRVAAAEHLPRDRDERLGRARLHPDIAADHVLKPGRASHLQRADLDRFHPLKQAPGGLDQTELVGDLSRPDQPLTLSRRFRRERGGPFQRGSRHSHGAPTPGDRSVRVQRCGDLLVVTDGGHRAMPEPTLGISDNLGECAVHLQHPYRGRGLPDRRANQRVAEPQLGVGDRDQARLNRWIERRTMPSPRRESARRPLRFPPTRPDHRAPPRAASRASPRTDRQASRQTPAPNAR